jgi:type II secretory pathway component GspD/PulD (secretin)
MKSIHVLALLMGLFMALSLPVQAQNASAPAAGGLTAGTTQPAEAAATNAAPAAAQTETNKEMFTMQSNPGQGSDEISVNFNGARINQVLSYLSDAAGLIIVSELPSTYSALQQTLSMTTSRKVTKQELVELLTSALHKSGVAVTKKDRILTLTPMENARTADLIIETPYEYESVDPGPEVVTALIHVRYADATSLVQNLNYLLPDSATLMVNASANTLIMVSSKTDLRRMLRIINELDKSISSTATTRVIALDYADATTVANLINSLYSAQNSTRGAGANNFMRLGTGGGLGGLIQGVMGGGGGGFGGGMGGMGGGGFGGGRGGGRGGRGG